MADTTNSKLIDITRLSEYDAKIKAWAKELDEPIDQDFTTNNTVGALGSGTVITKDMTLASLIAKMLVSVKDASVNTWPSCKLSNTGTAATSYEVGTTINTVLNCPYTDGTFTSYKAGSNTQTEVINAGCVQTGPKYTKGGVEYAADSFILGNGSNTITGSYTYSASTVKPKKSDGSESSISIAANAKACSSSLTWTGYYKFYEGAVDAIPAVINRANVQGLNQGAYKTSFSTKMNKKCYMICIPENKTIHVKDTATNADLTGTMTKKEVSIEDAAGRAKTYYMWTCEYASSVGLENNAITITFS